MLQLKPKKIFMFQISPNIFLVFSIQFKTEPLVCLRMFHNQLWFVQTGVTSQWDPLDVDVYNNILAAAAPLCLLYDVYSMIFILNDSHLWLGSIFSRSETCASHGSFLRSNNHKTHLCQWIWAIECAVGRFEAIIPMTFGSHRDKYKNMRPP